MARLRTVVTLVAAVCVVVVALGAGAASAGSNREFERYRAYALLRERLHSCSLDRAWHHLGRSARKRCRYLRRQYVLYSIDGESSQFFVYCKRRARRCPPAPTGVRSPRAPIPRGATVFR